MTRQEYTSSVQQAYRASLALLQKSMMSDAGKLSASLHIADLFFAHPHQGPFDDDAYNVEEYYGYGW